MEKTNDTSLKVFIILGWIFTVISLFFIPIVFGIAGIVFGALVIGKGRTTHGILMIVAAIICTIIGMVFGAMVMNNMSTSFIYL
ncbi:hypothetical protein [Staphylococcus pettenkoferi]|uniref:hypothetical protein n=1 Tax=Staphylococcus pettenkoferi TaxID=170573 RepID=UPI00066AB443|nr:hypothetical protein [Staphylococcus pettenkoferi]MDK7115678.1 hypothetical protein [Staphylococcus pettenkoferi]MDK7284338.1 hypothetical protein [Staphylococcus pettenkoferi]